MDDISDQEFRDLSSLVLEFSCVDRSCFPFSHLVNSDICNTYGFPPSDRTGGGYPSSKGNYVAGAIRRELKKESKSQKGSHFSDLSSLFDLPLEVILEIFEHLHPVDLYSLIRSSKCIRNLLLSRKSFAVWRQAFDRHPDIPSCPPDIPFPKWTSLLFGPSTCNICNGPEAMVDFTFLTRLCQSCLDEYSACQSDFEHFTEDPKQRDVLFTLVKASHRTSAVMYPMHYGFVEATYARVEVSEMARQMQDFSSAIEENVPNAEEKYVKFKSARAVSVQKATEHIEICNLWSLNIYRSILRRLDESLPMLGQRWGKLLKSLGHNSEDIEGMGRYIEDTIYDLGEKRYTKKAFYRSLPDLERHLSEQKAGRLEREYHTLISKRKDEVKAFYDSYQQTLDPITWGYLPGLDRILDMKPIFRYIYFREPDGTFPAAVAKQEVQTFIEKWEAVGRRHVSQMMPEHSLPESGDPLDLASAVFACSSRYHLSSLVPAFGWQEVALHLNCIIPQDPNVVLEEATFTSGVSYSFVGYDIIKYLLRILDLEPSRMQATELLAMKERFVCTTCPFSFSSGAKGRYSMTITECVSHALEKSDHTPRSFVPITEEATESVLFHERAYSLASAQSWSCRHCPKYFKDYATRKVVIAHLKEVHLIARPTETTDFFYHRLMLQIARKRYFLASDRPINYRCNKCIKAKNLRLWREDQIMSHLRDKHYVQNPTQGVEWIQIDLYEHVSSY